MCHFCIFFCIIVRIFSLNVAASSLSMEHLNCPGKNCEYRFYCNATNVGPGILKWNINSTIRSDQSCNQLHCSSSQTEHITCQNGTIEMADCSSDGNSRFSTLIIRKLPHGLTDTLECVYNFINQSTTLIGRVSLSGAFMYSVCPVILLFTQLYHAITCKPSDLTWRSTWYMSSI